MIYDFTFQKVKKRQEYEIISRKILGVNEKTAIWVIKDRYIRLSKKYHPDVSRIKNAENVFKDINTAYNILTKNNFDIESVEFLTIEKNELEVIVTEYIKNNKKHKSESDSGYYVWWQDKFF